MKLAPQQPNEFWGALLILVSFALLGLAFVITIAKHAQ
jgi:hypothetical protein